MTDEQILEKFGWNLDCQSPFEVSHNESQSFARGMAAQIVVEYLRMLYAQGSTSMFAHENDE